MESLGDVLRRIRYATSHMRFAVRRATRRLLGLDGEFRAGEDTERARHLSALWGMQWGDLPADSIELEVAAPERHVRLHNLPESKEEPETSEEMAEVLRRDRAGMVQFMSESVSACDG